MKTESSAGKPIRIFCSYFHRDKRHMERLAQHLSPLVREGLISLCYDGQLKGGDEWEINIDQCLNSAHIILLLVSAGFWASDNCQNEVERAIKRHDDEETLVIPILLRPCVCQGTQLARFEFLPRGKAIVEWPNQESAFADVARSVRVAALTLRGEAIGQLDYPAPAEAPSEINTQDLLWGLEFGTKEELDPTTIDAIVRFVKEKVNCTQITLGRGEKGALGPAVASSQERLQIEASKGSKNKTENVSVGYILIGDPDRHRFENLREIIKRVFGLEAIQAKTYLHLEDRYQADLEKLKLILFAEQLPYSDQLRSGPLNACLSQFAERFGATRTASVGIVYQNNILLEDITADECDFFTRFPQSEEDMKAFLESLQSILGLPSKSGSGRSRAVGSEADL